jgi:hypothetical protein
VRYAEISLADLRELLEDAEPIDPHPELVAAIWPTRADMAAAIRRFGWRPEVPYLRPAVPIRQED